MFFQIINKNIKFFLVFVDVKDASCEQSKYNSYMDKWEAHFACKSDMNCVGVYDVKCNEESDDFVLCSSYEFEVSSMGCVWQPPASCMFQILKFGCLKYDRDWAFFFQFENCFFLMPPPQTPKSGTVFF